MCQKNCMKDAPRNGDVILAWHKICDCWISVRWADSVIHTKNRGYVEATLTTEWPEEAFSHWINPPVATDQCHCG